MRGTIQTRGVEPRIARDSAKSSHWEGRRCRTLRLLVSAELLHWPDLDFFFFRWMETALFANVTPLAPMIVMPRDMRLKVSQH